MDVRIKLAFYLLFLSLVLLPATCSADDCGCGGNTPEDSSDISAGYGSSEDPVIHLVRAREYLYGGELGMAMDECKKSLALDPNNVQAHLLEGEILFRMGSHGEAAAVFQNITRMYPSEEEAYTRLGNTYLLLGDYHAAEKAYTRSLAIRPNDPVVMGNLEKAMRLAEHEKGVQEKEILEKDTVKGSSLPTHEESPAPVEITALPKDGPIPASLHSSTLYLSPVLLLFAFFMVALVIRGEKP